MRLYHWIVWARPAAAPYLTPAERQPACEAWLIDLSQNGTFVNRKLVSCRVPLVEERVAPANVAW